VRVNLIHSTLVFREKEIVYITMRVNLIHSKLVFFKKKYTKIKHTGKKKSSREQTASKAMNTVWGPKVNCFLKVFLFILIYIKKNYLRKKIIDITVLKQLKNINLK